jgi:hypothetical protein
LEKENYLFDQVGDFLAFFLPGFFLSTFLASLVKSPASLKTALLETLDSTNALEIQAAIA